MLTRSSRHYACYQRSLAVAKGKHNAGEKNNEWQNYAMAKMRLEELICHDAQWYGTTPSDDTIEALLTSKHAA